MSPYPRRVLPFTLCPWKVIAKLLEFPDKSVFVYLGLLATLKSLAMSFIVESCDISLPPRGLEAEVSPIACWLWSPNKDLGELLWLTLLCAYGHTWLPRAWCSPWLQEQKEVEPPCLELSWKKKKKNFPGLSHIGYFPWLILICILSL